MIAAVALLETTLKLIYLYLSTYPPVRYLLEHYSESAQDGHKSELFWPRKAIIWYEDHSTFLLMVGTT